MERTHETEQRERALAHYREVEDRMHDAHCFGNLTEAELKELEDELDEALQGARDWGLDL